MRPSQAYQAAINAATKFKHAQHVFKRAQQGIFHGRAIRFGNNVPESGQTTARTWLPNVQTRRIKSDILNRSGHFFLAMLHNYLTRNIFDHFRTMRWNITARAMRTVKKYGSLDKYVLGVRTKWLGERAMWLRIRLQDEIRKRELADKASSGENNNPVHAARSKTELERRSERLLLTMPVRLPNEFVKEGF
jgi:large subunit ribosomal protein L28